MSAISPIYNTAAQPADASRIPVQTLDQDDFLKLLVTQISSQDPMAPRNDTDFIAQMATFSSLEQAKSMQADIAQLRGDQQVLQANSLLGRTVGIQVDAETQVLGEVSAVQMEAGTPKVVVGGEEYTLGQVVFISPVTLVDN